MKPSLLNELLEKMNDLTSCTAKITQQIFINDLFEGNKSKKMAGEVMLLSNTIDVRQKMKEECNQKEFTIKLKKVIEDNWKIKIEDLAVELDILVKKTNFLTQSQRRALLKKPSAEEKMKQLL